MTYSECLRYLYDRLPIFHRTGPAAYKPGLGNIQMLCAQLGNPERSLKCVHVAGTNGKGSTSHLIASVLQEAGYKTGLHTSPHLIDFRERIRINGTMIPEIDVVDFVETNLSIWEPIQPSFFELSVAMTFWYFQKENVDICVIETGLGGRLDSTNIILPELSVITQIGLDHMNLLGDTIELIAAEKSGIIKSSIPVVIGDLTPEARKMMVGKSDALQSPLIDSTTFSSVPPTPLAGLYQKHNARTAYAALTTLSTLGWNILETHIHTGFDSVILNTKLRGRWETLRTDPLVICDVGHNEDGIRWITTQLNQTPYARLHFVLGVVNDKDLASMLLKLPKDATYYFCKANIPRGLDAHLLAQHSADAGLKGRVYDSVAQAYTEALEEASNEDLVFIGGSFFTVAEVLALTDSTR